MKARLRNAVPADIYRLEEIERQCFPQPHWTAENFLAYDCLVAEMHDRVVGFVVSRETFAGNEAGLPEREILNVAVEPDSRRRRIATTLLQELLQTPAIFFLEVRESNVGAQTLYRTLGFVAVGTRLSYYQEPVETAIVMRSK